MEPAVEVLSPFRVVRELGPTSFNVEYELSRVGDRIFLSAPDRIASVTDDGSLIPLPTTGLEHRPGDWTTVCLRGDSPESMFLLAARRLDAAQSLVFQRAGDRWRSVMKTPAGWTVLDLAAWSGASVLGVLERQSERATQLRRIGGTGAASVPSLAWAGDASRRADELLVGALATLPTGHVFAAGQARRASGADAQVPLIERWAPGKTQAMVEPLPVEEGARGDPAAIAAISPTEVHVVLNTQRANGGMVPGWALFDGERWRAVEVPAGDRAPMKGMVSHVWQTPGGNVWVATFPPHALWRRARDGRFATFALPSSLEPSGPRPLARFEAVAALREADVWAVASVGDRSYLLRAGAPHD